ncbi:MAG: hypothetical protein WD757_05680 [Actinomycetota bacterium]
MLTNSVLVLVRLIHITAAAMWAGSLFFFVFFVEPTSRRSVHKGSPSWES